LLDNIAESGMEKIYKGFKIKNATYIKTYEKFLEILDRMKDDEI